MCRCLYAVSCAAVSSGMGSGGSNSGVGSGGSNSGVGSGGGGGGGGNSGGRRQLEVEALAEIGLCAQSKGRHLVMNRAP